MLKRMVPLCLLSSTAFIVACGTDSPTDTQFDPATGDWPRLRVVNLSPNISVVGDPATLQSESGATIALYRDVLRKESASDVGSIVPEYTHLVDRGILESNTFFGAVSNYTRPLVLFGEDAIRPFDGEEASGDVGGPWDLGALTLSYFEPSALSVSVPSAVTLEVQPTMFIHRGYAYTFLIHGTDHYVAERVLGVRTYGYSEDQRPSTDKARIRFLHMVPDVTTPVNFSITVDTDSGTETHTAYTMGYNDLDTYFTIKPGSVAIGSIRATTVVGAQEVTLFQSQSGTSLIGGSVYTFALSGYLSPSVDSTLSTTMQTSRAIRLTLIRDDLTQADLDATDLTGDDLPS